MFTGRPIPAPGEPLFTEEDTAYAVALAEEERDTCRACGLPRAICRNPKSKFGIFAGNHDFCYASYTLHDYQKARVKGLSDAQQASVQFGVGFRKGHEPDASAGLGLDEDDLMLG